MYVYEPHQILGRGVRAFKTILSTTHTHRHARTHTQYVITNDSKVVRLLCPWFSACAVLVLIPSKVFVFLSRLVSWPRQNLDFDCIVPVHPLCV